MNALREALVQGLEALLGADATVGVIGGRLDAAEMRRMSISAPAVYLAILDAGALEIAGRNQWTVPVSWAAYVVTRDGPTMGRDEAAIALATKLLKGIAAKNWGNSALFKEVLPGSVRALNLYSGVVDSAATALWAVLWRQDCKLTIED